MQLLHVLWATGLFLVPKAIVGGNGLQLQAPPRRVAILPPVRGRHVLMPRGKKKAEVPSSSSDLSTFDSSDLSSSSGGRSSSGSSSGSSSSSDGSSSSSSSGFGSSRSSLSSSGNDSTSSGTEEVVFAKHRDGRTTVKRRRKKPTAANTTKNRAVGYLRRGAPGVVGAGPTPAAGGRTLIGVLQAAPAPAPAAPRQQNIYLLQQQQQPQPPPGGHIILAGGGGGGGGGAGQPAPLAPGGAPAAGARLVHIINIRQPDGSVKRIAYTGDAANLPPHLLVPGAQVISQKVEHRVVPAQQAAGLAAGLALPPEPARVQGTAGQQNYLAVLPGTAAAPGNVNLVLQQPQGQPVAGGGAVYLLNGQPAPPPAAVGVLGQPLPQPQLQLVGGLQPQPPQYIYQQVPGALPAPPPEGEIPVSDYWPEKRPVSWENAPNVDPELGEPVESDKPADPSESELPPESVKLEPSVEPYPSQENLQPQQLPPYQPPLPAAQPPPTPKSTFAPVLLPRTRLPLPPTPAPTAGPIYEADLLHQQALDGVATGAWFKRPMVLISLGAAGLVAATVVALLVNPFG